jgi:hypothetical protein
MSKKDSLVAKTIDAFIKETTQINRQPEFRQALSLDFHNTPERVKDFIEWLVLHAK